MSKFFSPSTRRTWQGALYHSQQAAEKALKAFLTWHDVPFRRVHDLDVIGGHCLDVDPTDAIVGRLPREVRP